MFISQRHTHLLSTTKADDVIHFEVASHKTSITKPHFTKLLGLTLPEVHVDPESIPTTTLIYMFYQIGYNGNISQLSKFKKSFLPPMWNGWLILLFKSFSEWVVGLDSERKLFYNLIYGLHHGANLDYGSILWTQIIQSTISMTRYT